MPICPRCSATIHTGADDQCPACGYSLLRANDIFGDRQVEFTRVLDEAGALTHQERMELLHLLEDLERNLPPIALCIYITDNGQVQHMRTHAHWILNHARIHHPSFGRREQRKAIEDAELRERRPGESPAPHPHPDEPRGLSALWNGIKQRWRDTFHPYPPPVRQEWMLILVMDVQLETACFSWGYMLDPYINPDSINSCIIRARLQFRERAMVTGIKRVMRSAVHNIAAEAHGVNRKLRRRIPPAALSALLLLGTSLAAWGNTAEPPSAVNPLQDSINLIQDDTAEEVTPSTPPTAPTVPQQPAPSSPSATGFDAAPRWEPEHYRLLMAGELATGYTDLFPAPPTKEEKETKQTASSPKPVKPAPLRRNRGDDETAESDTTVPVKYHKAYTSEAVSGLCDPQGLLTTAERDDVLHVLRELNANANFRIFATLFKGTQQIPTELTTAALTATASGRTDYGILLRYTLGNPSAIEIGYKEISADDATRHAWLENVRVAAASDGIGGVEGLMAALKQLSADITPLSADFKPLTSEATVKLPLVEIEYRPVEEKKDDSIKSRLSDVLAEPQNLPYLITAGIVLLVLMLTAAYYFLVRRRGAILLDTPPDLRLSSPYGAGVSRYVRYLEGKEASREKRLF